MRTKLHSGTWIPARVVGMKNMAATAPHRERF